MTIAAGGSQKTAELLARYSDIILRRNDVQDNKIDDILVWIIFVSFFVDYKLIFSSFSIICMIKMFLKNSIVDILENVFSVIQVHPMKMKN